MFNFLVERDVAIVGGRVTKKPTDDMAPSSVAAFVERVLVRPRTNEDRQRKILVGCWTLMSNCRVRYNCFWKYNQEHNSEANAVEFREPSSKKDTRNPEWKTVWHVNMGSIFTSGGRHACGTPSKCSSPQCSRHFVDKP